MGKKDRIIAYTDGSSEENPGIGGMAYVMLNWDKSEIIRKYRKFLDITTNNQAELLATIEAVEWFLENFENDKYLVVMTDARYCSYNFNNNIEKWEKKNWRNTKGKVPNFEMWKRLLELKKKAKGRIFFQWIKGHNGDEFNEMADTMCYEVWQRELKRRKNKKK